MLDLDKHFAVHAAALRLSAQRSEVIARNLANADTPNYKAVDFDFRKALDNALGNGGVGTTNAGSLRTTQRFHIGGASGGDPVGGIPLTTVERAPLAPSLDNNTVDVSLEQAEFSKNSIRYQASLNFLNSQMRGLMTAITGQ
ncbi:MAG: flagellar basal body rod protein FlgB [Pseudomonadota bacterium]|jgi:flagellar basal-body rod protein FlgB